MKTEEAKILLNKKINENRSELGGYIFNSAVMAFLGGITVATIKSIISPDDSLLMSGGLGAVIGAGIAQYINFDEINDSRNRIKFLKAIKKELETGNNIFEEVEIQDFQKSLRAFNK